MQFQWPGWPRQQKSLLRACHGTQQIFWVCPASLLHSVHQCKITPPKTAMRNPQQNLLFEVTPSQPLRPKFLGFKVLHLWSWIQSEVTKGNTLRATLEEGPRSRDQWIQAILLVKSIKLVPRPLDEGLWQKKGYGKRRHYLPSNGRPENNDVGNWRDDEGGDTDYQCTDERIERSEEGERKGQEPEKDSHWQPAQSADEPPRPMHSKQFLPHEVERHTV